MEADVFISYHTETSQEIVKAIVSRLENIGVRCWYAPRDVHHGSYAKRIAGAIDTCKIFLLILNKDASESEHVVRELDQVVSRANRKEDVIIIPFHVADKKEDLDQRAVYYIRVLHWTDAMTPPLYERINELVLDIQELLSKGAAAGPVRAKTVTPSFRLTARPLQVREIFDGRDDLIHQIHQEFQSGRQAVFLEGIGGIGKSELAKQYALRHRADYENILFLPYENSLEQLVCSIGLEPFPMQPQESQRDYFLRKLKAVQSVTDSRTLLIIDNFDVEQDADLDLLLEGSCKLLFTTRNSHPWQFSIPVPAIDSQEALVHIFEKNYGSPVEPEDRPYLEELFRLVENHTYTIELIAKQMMASFLSAAEMLEILKKGRLYQDAAETIAGRSDRKSAFGHICALFNTSGLTDEEKYLLRCLSITGIQGMPAARFRDWTGQPSFETVNRLIRRSWLRREAGQRISMHPLVRSVVFAMLRPTIENCRGFLEQAACFCARAWLRDYRENVAVTDQVLAMLTYFQEPDAHEYRIFEPLNGFLWQVGRFQESIHFGRRIYDACLKTYGPDSLITSHAAIRMGACYFNSGDRETSVRWYESSLNSILASEAKEEEDMAMAYEKMGRCYTWPYAQDLEKAREYLEKALEIRLRVEERFLTGEHPFYLMEGPEEYTLHTACSRIGENYMEFGRMYQAAKDYERALDYANKYEEIMLREMPDNTAGLAYAYFDQGVCYYHLGLKKREQGEEDAAVIQWMWAERHFKKALDLNLNRRGALALDTLDNQEYLADTYRALGRLKEASNGYMAVINMAEELLGKDSPRIRSVQKKMNFE